MKNFVALLALAALPMISTTNLHADTLAPGVTASLTNVTNSDTYAFAELNPNLFEVVDGTSTVTVALVSVGSAEVANVTDVCLSIDKAFCTKYAFSITDANFGGVSLGVDVSAYAAAQTTLSGALATVNLNGSVALGEDALVFSGAPASTSTASPVPEPGTLSLMATGLVGAAGALRRRFVA